MNKTKDAIMNYMKDTKTIQSFILKDLFRGDSDYDKALSSLIDENKLEEKHVNGLKMIKLGMAS